jgi:hypothetical protein
LRNKIIHIFLLSEDSKFFYKLNKELTSLNIVFKILNIGDKIPNFSCLILTTSEEVDKFENPNKDIVKIHAFTQGDNFHKYILKILAFYHIGYKEEYSELTFSIDPGTKHYGLAVFLDDYYLRSHTFYDVNTLVKAINDYIEFLQKDSGDLMNLTFKFGMGVFSTALELVSNLYAYFKMRKNMKVFLIDESKSSKINIVSQKKKIPKDEVSALILALRDGIEINNENYLKIFKDLKSKKIKLIHYENHFVKKNGDSIELLKKIIVKLLNRENSLSKSSAILLEQVYDTIA